MKKLLDSVIAGRRACVGRGCRAGGDPDKMRSSETRRRSPNRRRRRYKVNFDTSKGSFVIEVHRDWAPIGADRFYNLVKNGFYDDVRFFRVVPNFMAQFGMNGDPAVTKVWSERPMKDEPTKQGNKRGFVTFAQTSGPELSRHAAVHQLQGQQLPRRAGLCGVRRGQLRAWTSSRRSRRSTARNPTRGRSRPRAMPT